MKWRTHQPVALGMAFLLHMPLASLLAAWPGAVLPDILDQRLAALTPCRQRVFQAVHRGATHWFGWWLGLWMVGYAGGLPALPSLLLAGLGFGGLSHVALDLCTTKGVPLLPVLTSRFRFSLGLCRTGGWGEWVFLAVFALLFALLAREELRRLIFTFPL